MIRNRNFSHLTPLRRKSNLLFTWNSGLLKVGYFNFLNVQCQPVALVAYHKTIDQLTIGDKLRTAFFHSMIPLSSNSFYNKKPKSCSDSQSARQRTILFVFRCSSHKRQVAMQVLVLEGKLRPMLLSLQRPQSQIQKRCQYLSSVSEVVTVVKFLSVG